MKLIKQITILFLIIVQSLNSFSQSEKFTKDSILTTSIAKGFFNWYIAAAKNGKQKEYNPIEIEDSNGMTTLDFSKYFQNIIDHSFSDSLISKEKQSYNECIKKLSKIKYSDYLKLEDLDDFENLDDDFTNYYRWTGGQEMYDGYFVSSVSFKNNSALIIGYLYFDNSGNEIRELKNEITMNLIYQNNEWKITTIK